MHETLKTGTTTLGILAKDAVILAADMRATAGFFIAEKRAKKVVKIADNIGFTTAGSVSDMQLITKYIKSDLKLHSMRTGRAITVKESANLLSTWVYGIVRRMTPGVVHFVIGGYDKKKWLFEVYPDGSLMEADDYVCSGSGSPFAYGVLESQYKKDLSTDDAITLATKAVNAALQRDAASGNGMTIAVIDKDGFREVISKTIQTTV